jgi:hypothetical protein
VTAVGLWIGRPPRGTDLPSYTVAVAGGAGAPDAPHGVVLTAAAQVEVVARPATPAGEIEARGVVVHEGRASIWIVPVVTSAAGEVRVAGTAGALFSRAARRVRRGVRDRTHG